MHRTLQTKLTMKYFSFASFLILAFLCCSCFSNHGNGNMSGDVRVNFIDSLLSGSSFLKGSRLLYLDSDTEESLIIEVERLIVGDDRYFVVDRRGNQLLAFNGQGDFVASTADLVGEGPKNYVRLMDATIDNEQKKIYVHCDAPYCIMVFDMDLNLLEKVSLDYYMDEIVSDERFLYGIRMRDASNFGYELVALDKSNLSAAPEILMESSGNVVYGVGLSGKSMTSNSQGIFVCLPFDHTIYRVENKNVMESYSLDLGDKEVDPSDLEGMTAKEFFKSFQKDKIYMIQDIYASDSTLMFACNDLYRFVLNRKTKKCTGYTTFRNDLVPYSTNRTFPVQGVDRTFAYLWPSRYVMSHKKHLEQEGILDSEIYKGIENYELEDNPPIILCEMK